MQIPIEQTEITYGISVVMIKHSDDYARGAKAMSIGVCTKQKHFYCYRNLLLVALEMIFSEEYSQEEIAIQVYNSLNNANWEKLPILSEEESRIAKWLYYKQLSENFTNEIIETTFLNRNMYFEIDCTLEASEIMPVSFLPLLSIFKEKTMSLYDALIRGKRIILFSKNKPAWEVCTFACALTQLASPPLINIADLHLHPYAHLNNLDFLNSQFFIAGVTNPLFKIRPQWWDIFGDLDSGEIISHLPPPLEADLNFISFLLENLPSEHNKESYIRSQFFDYTQNIIDLAIFEEDFQEKGSKLQRARDWRGSVEFEYYSNHYKGKIFADEREPQYLIYKLLTRIRIAFAKEKIKGIRKMYYELDTLLSSRDECLKFLSMLPNNGDLHCLTCTFFLDNDLKTSRVACSILAKLEEIPEGKALILALPQNELNSYLAYRHRHAI
ncbi:unnamed protein product [Blepharisma stoltei]|uniref:UDENN domain-containing protein n=1 Tax=Blepharisma stoltei TaxID=1481888 RepID=A0AAU9JJE0_9CILI|nr:unnamed protein product [Blepharisma stoltei]